MQYEIIQEKTKKDNFQPKLIGNISKNFAKQYIAYQSNAIGV